MPPLHHCLSVQLAFTELYFTAEFREGTCPRSHGSLGACWTLEPTLNLSDTHSTSPISNPVHETPTPFAGPGSLTASLATASAPVRSKVKMSPSHLALLGVLGSELQLERLLILRLGEVGSSGAESRSGQKKQAQGRWPQSIPHQPRKSPLPTSGVLPFLTIGAQDGPGRGGQRLQGGRGQYLFRPKLGQLSKAFFEVYF